MQTLLSCRPAHLPEDSHLKVRSVSQQRPSVSAKFPPAARRSRFFLDLHLSKLETLVLLAPKRSRLGRVLELSLLMYLP